MHALKAKFTALSNDFVQYKLEISTQFDTLNLCYSDSISKQQLKQKIEELKDYVDKETGIFVTRFADIENRLTKLESTKEFDPEVTVIAINLEQSDGEIIMDKAHELVRNCMGSDVNIVRAKRLTPHGRAPGLVKIELPTLHDKIELLRKKSDLADSRVYHNVFVGSSKSHTKTRRNQYTNDSEGNWS